MSAIHPSKWSGLHPPKNSNCPYSVEFIAKPIPSTSLHSIEAGRVQLNVFLKGSSSHFKVEDVTASIINHSKQQIMDKSKVTATEAANNINNNTTITVSLDQDKSNNNNDDNNNWSGIFSIPSMWLEGGSKTFQRSGSHTPSGEKNAYSLQISYRLTDGKTCTAVFNSADAFHWSI
jgi:hypothetical protein